MRTAEHATTRTSTLSATKMAPSVERTRTAAGAMKADAPPTPSAHALEPLPAMVNVCPASVPVSHTDRRRELPAPSSDTTRKPAGEMAMPAGAEKSAVGPST